MYPVPRTYASGAELIAESRRVRERLWPVLLPMPMLMPMPMPMPVPELEPELLAPQPERRAVYTVIIISDDAYADMLRGWCRPTESEHMPKVEDIQRMVARRYDVSRRDIISSRRTAHVVLPRQIAMYLVRMQTLRSLPEIGRLFGKRDHTTVLHAVRKIALNIRMDVVFAAEIAEFVRQIEEWSVEPRAEAGG